jgi:phage-related protein (TIGR01555 family)
MHPRIARSFLYDSLVNLTTSLGTSLDKTIENQFALNLLDKGQLDNAYRGDWVARKAIDIPAKDSTRAWRAWQAKPDQIEQIEAEEKRLGIQQKLMLVQRWARLYGGAALVIGLGDDPTQEYNPERVSRGGLKFVHVVTRHNISTGEINWDVTSEFYSRPKYYTVTDQTGGLPTNIHPSRVIPFVGAELPDPALTSDGWGDSILQAVDDAIKNVASTTQNSALLVSEAKTDVVRIPDLMTNISTQEYKNRLTARFQYANVAKSVINTLILDKEEEWQRIQTDFSQLPELLRVYILIVSGAVDIPATRFLGQSPVGLNSTGESDTRNYYDQISAEQHTRISPTIVRLDDLIIRSATGGRDPNIFYNWNPLWQLSDSEKAVIAVQKATVFKIDYEAGLIDLEALRIGRQNQLIEDGTYPGLEGAIEEAENMEVEEPEELDEDLEEEEVVDARAQARDAKPRSLYVRRDVVNTSEILAWARAQGFRNIEDGLHVTIAYSRQPVDWLKVGEPFAGSKDGRMEIAPGGPRLVEELGTEGACVLMFGSSELCWRHEDIKRSGASWDFEDYQPHITISYDAGIDIRNVEPYRGKIMLGPEIFEEVEG